MDRFRNKFIIMFFAILAGGLALAISLLQLFIRAPALISSVSWNL